MTAYMILLIVAIVCWVVAAAPLPDPWKNYGIGWLGMFFWGISQLAK